jgi:two-component system, OmpR family, KDP operon response regulator KdpE
VARVLVVEDEPNIARIIEFKLSRERHQVKCVQLGSAVEHAMREFNPDVVLLDSTLDDMDAISLLQRLRSVPVVVMFDHGDTGARDGALACGAVSVIEKPFKPTLLARAVAQVHA